MDINFCRRCGAPVSKLTPNAFRCKNEHNLFYDAAPAAGAWIFNDKNEVLLNVRAVQPGKGKLCMPGGYCDYGEGIETALARELQEEVGLAPIDYSKPVYLGSIEDHYPWQGDVTRLLSIAFCVRLKPGAVVTPGDDAADARWFALAKVPRDQLAFPISHNYFLDMLVANQKTAE